MATCRLCDEDSASSCAAEIAEIDELLLRAEECAAEVEGLQTANGYADGYAAGVASMTPPSAPPPADHPCDTAYHITGIGGDLLTLTQAYDWYAPHKEDEHTRVKLIGCMHARASATPDGAATPQYGCLLSPRCTGARSTATAAPSR